MNLHFNRKDLTGMEFGKLTVLRPGPKIKFGTCWECICECGTNKIVKTSSLMKGTQSCGCLIKYLTHKRCFMDLTGRRFGRLTVISPGKVVSKIGGKKDRKISKRNYWICKCDCGNMRELSKDTLRQGTTQSCGCLRSEAMSALCGPMHPCWNGGRSKTDDGYISINVGASKRKLEHVIIMEKFIGRPLFDKETVHHKNGIRDDNRIENLELWASNHPSGQRVDDLITYSISILSRYKPNLLSYESRKAG